MNNIDNITSLYIYSSGDNTKNEAMLLDLLEEAKEVRVKEKYKETNMMLANKSEVEGTVAVGGVTSEDLQGELRKISGGLSQFDAGRKNICDRSYKAVSSW